MMKLYYLPGSAAMAPHAVLEEAGADYELVRVTREDGKVDPPEFAGLTPQGRVPAFVDGDLVLHESAAIVMHLCDSFPETGLAPALATPERAHWYRWLTYLTNTVQPTYLAFRYPGRYTSADAAAADVSVQAATALGEMRDFLAGALQQGGPYLLGERLTSADFYLYMITRWCRHLEPKWWDHPVLGAHYRLLGARPAIQRMREQQGLDDST